MRKLRCSAGNTKKLEKPKCLSTGKWTGKKRHIHTAVKVSEQGLHLFRLGNTWSISNPSSKAAALISYVCRSSFLFRHSFRQQR